MMDNFGSSKKATLQCSGAHICVYVGQCSDLSLIESCYPEVRSEDRGGRGGIVSTAGTGLYALQV